MGSENVVPGGNVAKPLVIALLALLASRYFSGKGNEQSKSAGPAPAPELPAHRRSVPDDTSQPARGGIAGEAVRGAR